ncbi:disulfide-isomerase like 2-2 [Micractinium conductrix]|uniref:Disulfide-isomerase like 2-2 n=1 Tax=Micractinium conductrix TaxID=554055 RepID=A0A2P6VQZ9_9CHLO|nr:disulfide-isomerase like 2-2 [Micractinium conductrix]|eukprot:PSC76497.1 disulfide-isomerase like 2-2 [Micractinium conductrix]
MPDTLVLRRGEPVAWFATNKEGYVVQRPAARTKMEDVRTHLLSCALDDRGRYPQYVAVARSADGMPKLLTRANLDALCERMSAAAEAGDEAEGAPCVLQAYTSPLLDLRFVTSYSNDGTHIACHTFQRRFSRRYLPQRDAAASPRGEPSGAAGAAGGAQDGEEGAEQLDEGALADSERSLGLILGPVDPALKMTAGRAAHGVVQYVQKAHLLTLRGLVCEFVRDGEGHLWFLGPLRAEWASLIPGRGGEPWANANLMQQPREAKSCASSAAEEVEHQLQRPQESSRPAAAAPLPPAADSPCAAPVPAACDSPSSRLRSKGCKVSPAVAELLDHLPSALQQPSTEQQPGSPRIPAVPAAAASTPGLPAEQGVSPNTAALLASPAPPVMQQEAPTQSPKPAARRGGGGGGHKERLMASSPTATGRSGSLPASPTRVSAGLASSFQLTRELESLRDELLIKTDLADALACKVHALEHDKHVITGAFEAVVGGMQADLVDVKQTLEALRVERDSLTCQLAETSQRMEAAEAERDQLRAMLDSERGAAFLSLGQFQKQQEDAGVRAARAEAELRTLQERYREEQAACDALKKLMVFYQHSVGDSSFLTAAAAATQEGGRALRGIERPEMKYSETLQDVDELLMREVDPPGERYALSKVLHTCQADLHAIFLHYTMLDAGFARHWPPQLTMQGWLAFMKDIGSTNLVPGMRTRSDNTMNVQEATEVFRRYCLRQAVMRGAGTLLARTGSMVRIDSVPAGTPGGASGDALPPRPPSSHSTTSGAPTARPFSAASAQMLASATMSHQSFCAALVHVAAKLARGSPEVMEACPFLSEQTRSFIESIVPKAQRVAPIAQSNKKGGGAGSASPGKGSPAGGLGAKEAAAKEAAAKLEAKKSKKSKAKAATAVEMCAIAEASREGSGVP